MSAIRSRYWLERYAHPLQRFALSPHSAYMNMLRKSARCSSRTVQMLATAFYLLAALSPTGAATQTPPSGPRPTPSQLYTIRLHLLQNPSKVPELIRARPAYKDGSLIGYRVEPGPRPRLFYRLGLHPGDVVTRINGTVVTPGNRLWLISQVSLSSQVDVTLLRQGHRRTFDYRFRAPSQ